MASVTCDRLSLRSSHSVNNRVAKTAIENSFLVMVCVGATMMVATANAAPNTLAARPSLSDITVAGGGTGKDGFTVNGVGSENQFGTTIADAGDLNGDGIDDIAIGAPSAAPGRRVHAGQVSVVYGQRGPRRTGFSAAALLSRNGGDGSAGFVVNGIDSDDAAGASLDIACDINGDAIDDLIIGAPGASVAGARFVGESYVVFGSDRGFPAQVELASLLAVNGGDGSAGFVVRGIAAHDASGATAESAGDVNGDGLCDIVVAAPGAAHAYVLFGSKAPFAAEMTWSELLAKSGRDGFVIDASGAGANGVAVGSVGDINGDSLDDLAIGISGAGASSRPFVGTTLVLYGSKGGFDASLSVRGLLTSVGDDDQRGFLLLGPDVHAGARPAGDINGDGIDDLIVSAPQASSKLVQGAGVTYAVFGSRFGFPAKFMLADLHAANGGDGRRGFVANGFRHKGAMGSQITAAGDLNSDGIDDIIIAAPNSDIGSARHAGEIYVLLGNADGFAAELPLARLLTENRRSGPQGFALQGSESFEFTGVSLATGGDINGDRIDDVLIGAHRMADDGRFGSGRVFVLYGRAEGR